MKLLLTGAAGFIGFHCAKQLLSDGWEVLGIDNLNNYYDPLLKQARLMELQKFDKFSFAKADLSSAEALNAAFDKFRPAYVLHLAAQAGVRYSLTNPNAYTQSNLVGFVNVLEACRQHEVSHFVFASSSSVYGANRKVPFSVDNAADHPVSLYAATKRANELLAHSYSHLYSIPSTGLRFFTVYGPWGRPDMAYFSFTQKMFAGEPIEVFNAGKMSRDFTYIDDIVSAIVKLLPLPPKCESKIAYREGISPAKGAGPFRVFNVGNSSPVDLLDFINILQKVTGIRSRLIMREMSPGDVHRTYADIEPLRQLVGFNPTTTLEDGLERFVVWYKRYFSK